MQFIVKFFPEITIKSKPVRKMFVKHLRDNLRHLLRPLSSAIGVESEWDRIVITADDADDSLRADIVSVLSRTPGIAYFTDVLIYPLLNLHDIYEKTHAVWAPQLAGKTFAVRCRRVGKHEFSSLDIERYVGGGLRQHSEAAGINLSAPDVTVHLEVRDERVFIVNRRHEGLGGFPLGCLDAVLSLVSGGFDSTVASYLTMKRGMRTHFCFFNLGGREHEVGVKEVAYYLWQKYGASSRVMFVTVPFEEVVAEILQKVSDSQMGVVLKRMMLRAASQVAAKLEIKALVTGEAVAQVSSQTLQNLTVIDAVTDTFVMRPLIVSDKSDIIRVARQIGAEQFAAAMPEYCGVISVKPTTRARPERIVAEEQKFSMEVLERAIADARYQRIDELANDLDATQPVEEVPVPAAGEVVIDVRHPQEAERKPLQLSGVEAVSIPFYELARRFGELDTGHTYLLYCDKGVMSRLHAAHLREQGFANVKVYRP